MRWAVQRLADLGTVVAISSLYETEPVGYREQPWFYNAVVALATALTPGELLTALRTLEREAGRERPFPNAPRTLDLDLLLYGEEIVAREELTVPHPRMHERAFVLVPLLEIAPQLVDLRTKRPLREALAALGDWSLSVRRIAGPEWAREE